VHRCCRSGQRRGRTDTWPGAQENLRDTDADAAPKKENCQRDEREIADANTNSVAKEKAFAATKGRGIANAVADFFPEKETNSDSGTGDSHADSEEEKDLADACTHRFSASQEEGIAHSGAI